VEGELKSITLTRQLVDEVFGIVHEYELAFRFVAREVQVLPPFVE